MKILSSVNQPHSEKNVRNSSSSNNLQKCRFSSMHNGPGKDTVSFSGHAKMEQIFNDGIMHLVQQTAFDREPQTKDFVCDYIRKTFGHKDKIKIVSGGCSTGEEPVTYSMLLYDMRNKVDILGIDLGKKAIKQAKSRRFVFEIPKNNYDFEKERGIENPYTDTYLTEPENKGLTASQQRFKSLFNEFFEPTNEKIRTPFAEWIRNLMQKKYEITSLELDRKSYQLKDGMAENCNYVVGDIQDIDKILKGEKADVISFNNALYHLTTEYEYGDRIKLPYAEETTEELMTKFKDCLNENGIVVFGEDEGVQLADKGNTMVPNIMKKLGFTPLNNTNKHDANVWKKGK